MKKYFTIAIFTVIVFFAYSAETLLSTEYQYGISFSKGEDVANFNASEKNLFSIGEHRINVKTYTFWNNQSIGLFTQAGVLLPYFGKTTDKEGYIQNIGIPLSFGAGAGFRYVLSEKAAILYSVGLGFNFSVNFSKYELLPSTIETQEQRRRIAFSLLSDIGYTYNISPNVYLNTGANFNLSFAQHLKAATKSAVHNDTISKWVKGFFSFEFLPYIGIGFVINSK
ncbi:MAG: hypothetical protein ACTTI3_08900 [Treponema sp.]